MESGIREEENNGDKHKNKKNFTVQRIRCSWKKKTAGKEMMPLVSTELKIIETILEIHEEDSSG